MQCIWTRLLCSGTGGGWAVLQGPFLLIQSHYHPTVTVSLSRHPSQSPECAQTSQLNHILHTNGRGHAAATVSNLICASLVSPHTHTYIKIKVSGKAGLHRSSSILYNFTMCGETRVSDANQKSGFASIIGALSAH